MVKLNLITMHYMLANVFVICFLLTGSVTDGHSNDEVFCNKQPYRVKVTRIGCSDEFFTVSACLGNCASYQKPLQDLPYFRSECYQCKASVVIKKQFRLSNCISEVDNMVTIESAEVCKCEKMSVCWSRERGYGKQCNELFAAKIDSLCPQLIPPKIFPDRQS